MLFPQLMRLHLARLGSIGGFGDCFELTDCLINANRNGQTRSQLMGSVINLFVWPFCPPWFLLPPLSPFPFPPFEVQPGSDTLVGQGGVNFLANVGAICVVYGDDVNLGEAGGTFHQANATPCLDLGWASCLSARGVAGASGG